jgi:hypothetical protein
LGTVSGFIRCTWPGKGHRQGHEHSGLLQGPAQPSPSSCLLPTPTCLTGLSPLATPEVIIHPRPGHVPPCRSVLPTALRAQLGHLARLIRPCTPVLQLSRPPAHSLHHPLRPRRGQTCWPVAPPPLGPPFPTLLCASTMSHQVSAAALQTVSQGMHTESKGSPLPASGLWRRGWGDGSVSMDTYNKSRAS